VESLARKPTELILQFVRGFATASKNAREETVWRLVSVIFHRVGAHQLFSSRAKWRTIGFSEPVWISSQSNNCRFPKQFQYSKLLFSLLWTTGGNSTGSRKDILARARVPMSLFSKIRA
jgi:hypothetical protein